PAGTWRFVGVLIESPEAIDRLNRFQVKSLNLLMGSAGFGISFDIGRRDRSGTRILFATTSAFAPTMWRVPPLVLWRPPLLELEVDDFTTPGTATTRTGYLLLPLLPSFAAEAI